MSAKEIPVDAVPGLFTLRKLLESVDSEISVVAAGDDFDAEEYVLKIAGPGRSGRVNLPYDMLRDLHADTGANGKAYSSHLSTKVGLALREAVECMKVKS